VTARLAALVLALGAAIACSGAGARDTPRHRAPVSLTLPAADGGEIDFLRLRGRLVVVHVFATWSLDAQADIEQLDAVFAGNAVAVVGLAVDLNGTVAVPPWQRGSGARYPAALADDGVRAGNSPFGAVDRVPMTFILDRSGVIVRHHVGRLPPGALAKWLRELQ
jgi:hypothetical protein